MGTEFLYKPNMLVVINKDNGTWYKKGVTGKIIKFDHRKDGKEYWVVEIRNSQFTVCETDMSVYSKETKEISI